MKKKSNKVKHGHNVFGERCEVRTLTLKKETALAQCVDMMNDIMLAEEDDRKIEYTVRSDEMTNDEVAEVMEKVKGLISLYAKGYRYQKK